MRRQRGAPQPKPKSGGSSRVQQLDMGMFGIPDMDMDDDDDENDDALEAELMSILSSPGSEKPRLKPKPKPAAADNLDRMVAESLKDIPSDAELSGDDDDPELLAELSLVTGSEDVMEEEEEEKPSVIAPTYQNQDYIRTINERIAMYREAEKNAKINGESSKVRRLGRGLQTLETLLKKAKAGGVINESDIPLPVTVSAPKPSETHENGPEETAPAGGPQPDTGGPQPDIFLPLSMDGEISEPIKQPESPMKKLPSPVESSSVLSKEQTKVLETLRIRRDQYKNAALIAKKAGDLSTALNNVKLVKQFETVIAAAESGQPVDLSNMPPPPAGFGSPTSDPIEPEALLKPAPPPTPPRPSVTLEQPVNTDNPVENVVPEEPKVPATVLEALEQRLAKFKEQEEAAKKDGNSGKIRRMGRIIKQYQDAIRLHKAGKPIPVDDLPTPPGFAPIPVDGPPKAQPPPPSPTPSAKADSTLSPEVPSLKPTRSAPEPPPRQPAAASTPSPPAKPSVPSKPGTMTRQDKQFAILTAKQKQFKEAARQAKQNGNIELAKEFLRLSKCFDPLIDATINGIPVDMTTLPAPPGSKLSIEKDFEIVKVSDCIPGTTSEIYNQLIIDLQKQLKTCMETRAHFKAMGDVASANKFENLAVNTKKDLDTVKIACNKDDPVPRFHYEMRTFSIVRCNTDLSDNDVELSIIQGINYNVPNPKEIDTYVRYEFPYPTEDPKKDKTNTIYNTNNPVYDGVFLIPIQRTNRACQRIFKRQSIKLEIWSRGGFLRSDVLIGTVNVKLTPLETHCTIHDSFELMNGKKKVGGKLEIKVRVRHPIQMKQLEQMQEKWLVID